MAIGVYSLQLKRQINAPHEYRILSLRPLGQTPQGQIASFEQYPFYLPVVLHLEQLELHPAVTFLSGENGSGKSTLMEAIAVAWGFNPEGGTRNFKFQTRASHSALHEYLRLVKSVPRPRDGFFPTNRELVQPRIRNRAS